MTTVARRAFRPLGTRTRMLSLPLATQRFADGKKSASLALSFAFAAVPLDVAGSCCAAGDGWSVDNCPALVNVAVTARAWSIVSTHEAVPLHGSDQPPNVEPEAGFAVSVTTVPGEKARSQSGAQARSPTSLLTVPAPDPDSATDSLASAAADAAREAEARSVAEIVGRVGAFADLRAGHGRERARHARGAQEAIDALRGGRVAGVAKHVV